MILTLTTSCTGAPAPVDSGSDATICSTPTEQVDVLLVISGRYYAQEHQGSLGAQLLPLFEALTTGDADGDGTPDQRAAPSLRVGVVTADLGASMTPAAAGCTDEGDDARLRTTSPGSPGEILPAVTVVEPGTDLAIAAQDVAARIAIGNDDCFVVQSLESALKALSPRAATSWTASGYAAPTFASGTGHGDDANAGLVRDESALVVVFLSAFDDISLAERDLFSLESERYDGPVDTRALRYPDALQPVLRHAEGLAALRRDPARLVVVSIVGAPPIDDPGAVDADALLAREEMQIRFTSPDEGERPVPACQPASVANAGWPGRRHVELARELETRGAQVVIGSICDPFDGVRVATARAVGRALEGTACR